MRKAVVLAAALILAPRDARAADLVVWWDEGYYADEAEAVREIVAAFEQETGKQVGCAPRPTPQGTIERRESLRPPAGGEMQGVGEVEPLVMEVERPGHHAPGLDRDPGQAGELSEPDHDRGVAGQAIFWPASAPG